MKRSWAVLLAAAMLASCRSAQPTPNPFLRTTVPPPTTGTAPMVVPGQPYPAATAPPVITTPATVAPPPQVITTPAPAMAPPPVIAPPPAAKKEFNPPGGSFLFHQSSNERGQKDILVPPSKLAATAPANSPPVVASMPGAVTQASYIENPYVQNSGVTQASAEVASDTHEAISRGDPPDSVAASENGSQDAGPGNTLRFVGVATTTPSAVSGDASGSEPDSKPVLGVVAGPPPSASSGAWKSTSGGSSLVASVTSPPKSTSQTSTLGSSGVSQVAFVSPTNQTPGMKGNSEYAYAADYSALRGWLDYSASTRQWKLRYIPIDGQTDSYGGSVIFSDSKALKEFRSGDRVSVRGGLLVDQASSSGFAPRYRLDQIERLAQ